MSRLAGPQAHSRGTAQRNRAEVALEESSPVGQVSLDVRQVVQRVHMQVLIIGEYEQNLFRISTWPTHDGSLLIVH